MVKRALAVVIFFTLQLFATVTAHASGGWHQSQGPEGGWIISAVADPANRNVYYAATMGGVYKSTDRGSTWTAVNNGLTGVKTTCITIDPATRYVYVGTYNGIWKTNNGGLSWRKVVTKDNVTCIAVDPTRKGWLYAGGLFGISNGPDSGQNWRDINNGLAGYAEVTALVVHPTKNRIIFAGTSTGEIYRTGTRGSWRLLKQGGFRSPINCLAIDAFAPKTIYAGGSEGRIYKSEDEGSSWSNVDYSSKSGDVLSLKINPLSHAVYAALLGSSAGVIVTTNGGRTWANTGLHDATSLILDNGGLVAGTHSGIWRRSAATHRWLPSNTGLKATVISSLAGDSSGKTVYAGSWGSGIFKSDNGRWTNIGPLDLEINSVVTDPVKSGTIYGAALNTYRKSGGFYLSADGGNTWSRTGLAGKEVTSIALDTNTVYAGADEVYASTDGGASWHAISSRLAGVDDSKVTCLLFDSRNNTLYAGTEGYGIFKYTNGSGWAPLSNGLTGGQLYFRSVATDTNGTVYAGTDGGIITLANQSARWEVLSAISTKAIMVIENAQNPSYIAGTPIGVGTGDTGGTSFALHNDGLSVIDTCSLAVLPSTIVAGTMGGGVFWISTGAAIARK